ncbi:MAG: hypothetical protein JSW26_00105 [Desulfobacterales bacterium]|nr:MAG: hypothetical protein JSW26_00105 [Desulfobacterales bacterium]
MALVPMLDDWEIPRIEKIAAVEHRRLAPLLVPGLHGTLHQDLGTESIAVEIVGSLHEEEMRDDFFTNIRAKFQEGEPVSFTADIVSATELELVIIEDLRVTESNDWARRFQYRIVLREYVEPPEPAAGFDDLGADLGIDAELDLEAALSLDGFELPGLLVDVPTLGDPVAPILPALDGVASATEPVNAMIDELKGLFD